MRETSLSRRTLLGAGGCALAAAATLPQLGAAAHGAIECYFGAQNNYPSAVNGQK